MDDIDWIIMCKYEYGNGDGTTSEIFITARSGASFQPARTLLFFFFFFFLFCFLPRELFPRHPSD